MQSLWMVLATLFFAFGGLCVKLAAAGTSSVMIVGARGLMGVLIAGGWAWLHHYSLKTPHPWAHARRSGSGATSVLLFTYALTQLPLAAGTTLNYTSAIWLGLLMCLGAWWRGKPLPSKALLACVLVGFAGVVLLLRPSLEEGKALAYGLGLFSGLLSALAYSQIKLLGQYQEPEWRIVFYQSLTLVLAASLLVPIFGFGWANNETLLYMLGNGILATLGQTALTRAYAKGGTLLTSSLQYLAVVFAAFLGAAFVGDALTASDYAAILIIVGSGLAAGLVSWVRKN